MALCLPVLDTSDGAYAVVANNDSDNKQYTTTTTTTFQSLPRALSFAWTTLCHFVSNFFLVWTFCYMFRIETIVDHNDKKFATTSTWNIRLLTTPSQLDKHIETLLPYILSAVFIWVSLQIVCSCIASPLRKSIPIILHGVLCLLVMSMIALPMTTLNRTLQRNLQRAQKQQQQSSSMSLYFWASNPTVLSMYSTYVQPNHLTNGYGLFRRMTGVGPNQKKDPTWGGVPVSRVERPEIIVEGLFRNTKSKTRSTWKELQFRYKPSDQLQELPYQIAPHQPRLDWQMWFAALGQINHNPWLIHLLYKIVEGCHPVVELLHDDTQQLLLSSNQEEWIFQNQVRAKLYHYDFTRWNTTWNQIIPNVEIVDSTNSTSNVWYRTFSSSYVPPLTVDHPSLVNFVESNYAASSICIKSPNEDRCQYLPNNNKNWWCHVTQSIRQVERFLTRQYSLEYLPLVVCILFGFMSCFMLQTKKSPAVTNKTRSIAPKEEKSNSVSWMATNILYCGVMMLFSGVLSAVLSAVTTILVIIWRNSHNHNLQEY